MTERGHDSSGDGDEDERWLRAVGDDLARTLTPPQQVEQRLRGLLESHRAGGRTPSMLPAPARVFAGRTRELEQLTESVEATDTGVVIHAIGGMGGVGKTTLALQAAHQLAPRFPDGHFFLNLRAHTPGATPLTAHDALASLLLADGMHPTEIPGDLRARAFLWQARTTDRRIIVMLDDAADAEQVRNLLPAGPHALVLVTSRGRLAGLHDAAPVDLTALTPHEAAGLFVRLIDRPGIQATDPDIMEVARACGYLPLALRVVAARLRQRPQLSPADLLTQIERNRLDALRTGERSLSAVFDLSYRALTHGQQRLFRLVGAHPGIDFDVSAAAALLDTDAASARRLLEDLLDHNLLLEQRGAGRYQMHDLLRDHARAQAAADPEETAAALTRLLDSYLRAAESHGNTAPGRERVLGWLRSERHNLLSCIDYATHCGEHATAIRLTAAIAPLLHSDGPWPVALNLHGQAVSLAQHLGDRRAEANACHHLGVILRLSGDYPQAGRTAERALAIYKHFGDRLGQADALNDLAQVRRLTDDYPGAVDAAQHALVLYRQLGDGLGQASALHSTGEVQRQTGDYSGASETLEQALQLYQQLGSRLGQANALHSLGEVLRLTDDYSGAVNAAQHALTLYRDLGSRLGQADALNSLGVVYRMTGDYPAAVNAHTPALEFYRELGSRLGQADALQSLGEIHRLTGQHAGATEAHTHALALYRELGSRLGEANALHSLGEIHRLTGQHAAATEAHTHALALYRELGSRLGEANALNGLGVVFRMTGDYPAAVDAHLHALGFYRELGGRLGQADALHSLGEIHRLSGQHTAAIEELTHSLELYKAVNNLFGQANTLNSLGSTLRALDEYPRAIDVHEQALRLYRQLGDRSGEIDALLVLGRLQEAAGHFVDAVHTFEKAMRLDPSLDRYHEAAGERSGPTVWVVFEVAHHNRLVRR